ncbi:restriction endonuclease subunit S, partial [Candidatus Saccharibacteria bacterium]|nr:restriction endonuclease subunit S [Candidatus Saccharibacteria bacterium]
CAVIPNNSEELDARYLHQYLQFYKDTALVPLMKGAANVSLSMKDIAGVSIPLPPIKRQRELAEMFVTLQEKQKELFAELEKQAEYAKQLRQNILQEAIEGKITADWRKQHPVQKGNPDYDAEALFQRILEEKRTAEDGNGKKRSSKKSAILSEAQSDASEDLSESSATSLFEIPQTWKWVKLKQLATVGTGATPLTTDSRYYKNGNIPWITSSATSNEYVTESDSYITEVALKETNCSINPIGTLVIAMYGQGKTRGQITELMIEAATNQACATVLLNSNDKTSRKYVKIVFWKMYEEIRSLAQGGAQPNLNLSKIANTIFPLPPLAEQKEIVTRVEKHLQTITQLETQIATRETTTKQLMQSILKDAFEEE